MALIHSKQLNPKFTGSFAFSGSTLLPAMFAILPRSLYLLADEIKGFPEANIAKTFEGRTKPSAPLLCGSK